MTITYRDQITRDLTPAEVDANFRHVLDSANQTFTPSGIGATARTVASKLGDFVHVKDFGAACDGSTDDTTAVTNAIAALPSAGGTLYYSGTPLLSSKITITKRVRLVADGAVGINSSARPASYFIKKSTMTTQAIEFSGSSSGAGMDGGGVVAQGGNTGPNIAIMANSIALRQVYSEGAGTYGVFVDGSANNANHWRLDHCRAYGNGSHGFYFDGASGTGNANAGTAVNCIAQNNTGDGFNSNYAQWNAFVGCGADTNTGYGIHFQNGIDNSLVGGDFEGNTAGQIKVDSGERYLSISQKNSGYALSDSGYYTRRLDRFFEKRGTFTPAIRGATGGTKTGTAVSVSGATATITSAAHGYSNGDTIYQSGFSNPNLNGAFVIANVAANTYDITFRTDASATAPTSASGLSTTLQKCGASSVAVGRYTVRDGTCDLYIRITMSSVTNITGTAQIVLPFASDNIDANLYASCRPSYYTGITHTGKLEIIVQQNGAVVGTFYDTISGAPGAAAQFGAAGLSATADLIIEGRYLIAPQN